MLTANQLTFEYSEKPIFKNISFALKEGQLLHLRGPNGAGKTTLLKLLAGLLVPSKGVITYEGQSIHSYNVDYQKKRCFIGYRNGINPFLTVRENCLFDPNWDRCPMTIEALLKRFDVTGLKDIRCQQLSAGQKRRVGLLRLGMTDAKLWLCDEPFVALDNGSVDLILSLFKQHLLSGGQIVLASHGSLPESWDSFIEFFNLPTCI